MLWFSFALINALLVASRRIYEKSLTESFSNFTMGFISQFFAILPALLLLFILPVPVNIAQLPAQFWLPLLGVFCIYPVQTYFMYSAIRKGELSSVMPIMSLIPVFNMATSYMILGERPTTFGLLGVLSIVVGTYLLLKNNEGNKHTGHYDKAVLYMIGATLCIALGTTFDKVAINVSTPAFYSFANILGASVIFFILLHVYGKSSELKKIPPIIVPLSIFGLFKSLAFVAGMFAFSYGPTSYVLAVESLSFLFVSLYAILFMNEKLSPRKSAALGLFLLGIFFITTV